jgi:hypothetical protein
VANQSEESKIFSLMQVCTTHIVPRMLIEKHIGGGEFKADAIVHQAMDALVLRLHGFLAADQLEVVEIKYPRDWWEAAKERFAPQWALRRWPVRYREHRIDLKAVFPEFVIPKMGPYIRVQRHETNDWADEDAA